MMEPLFAEAKNEQLEDNGETFAEDVKEKTTKEHLNETD